MTSHSAQIQRSNGKALHQVQVTLTVTDRAHGAQSWSGEFSSLTTHGFQPSERFSLTLDSGEKGSASVSRTVFNSRNPQATVVEFKGTGLLA